jgi:hypothetical protein
MKKIKDKHKEKLKRKTSAGPLVRRGMDPAFQSGSSFAGQV